MLYNEFKVNDDMDIKKSDNFKLFIDKFAFYIFRCISEIIEFSNKAL